MLLITLRHYQDLMANGIRDAFSKGFKYVLAVLPTGGGKTILFTYIAQKMDLKGKRVVIMAHRIELIDQISDALSKFNVEHGMINPKYTPNYKKNSQVASIGTVISRLKYFLSINWFIDVLIIDEAHHANSKSWGVAIAFFKMLNPNLLIIGVTATPIRGDGQGLGVGSGGIFETMVEGPDVAWLQEEGFLVKTRVLGPPEKIDLTKVHTQAGDYKKKELSELVNKPKITGEAVDHYREICPGAPAIVFCVSVEHAESVAEKFRAAGFKFYSIDGSMDDDTRKQLIRGLTKGTIDGLTSCDLISEGTDIPRATCAIELRPTQSKGLNMQQRGRVLRPVYAPGFDKETKEGRLAAIAASEKPYAIILDHVGNSDRHGLPHWENEWTLDGCVKKRGSKKQEEAVKVIMCESCFMMQEPTTVCVGCGHVMKPPKNNVPKQVEGNLVEITDDSLRAKQQLKKEVSKAKSFEDLLKIAKERGFRPEWANHIDMSRQKKLEKMGKLVPLQNIAPIPAPVNNGFDEDLNF